MTINICVLALVYLPPYITVILSKIDFLFKVLKFDDLTASRLTLALYFHWPCRASSIDILAEQLKALKSVDISAVEFAPFLVIIAHAQKHHFLLLSDKIIVFNCDFLYNGLNFVTSQAKSRRWLWRVFPTKITLCITRFSVENSPWRDLCQIWCNC